MADVLIARAAIVDEPSACALGMVECVPSAVEPDDFPAFTPVGPTGGMRLWAAADWGQEDIVKRLLAAGANVNGRPEKRPLRAAASSGHLGVATLLVEHGADVDLTDGESNTPLRSAVWMGDRATAEYLIEHGATIDIDSAAALGLVYEARNLLAANPALAHGTGKPYSTAPLHLAAEWGHLDMVELLIAHHADPNAVIYSGLTPLDEALFAKQKEVARLLIAKGATVDIHAAAALGMMDELRHFLRVDPRQTNQPDPLGYTPLTWAAGYGQIAAAELLVAHGANPADKDSVALHWAVQEGQAAMIDWLIARGADVNSAAHWGNAPLHVVAYAQKEQQAGLVRTLVAYGARVNARGEEGRTPLHFAAEEGAQEAARALLEAGAGPDAKAEFDVTPLHSAARNGHLEVVSLLLAAGADVDARTLGGKTALELSERHCHREASEVLRRHRMQSPGDTSVK